MAVTCHPCTDSYVRNYRIRLLPRETHSKVTRWGGENFLARSLLARMCPSQYWFHPQVIHQVGKSAIEGKTMSSKSDNDNHSNQLNDNNDAYWLSRGYDERPDDWDDRSDEES